MPSFGTYCKRSCSLGEEVLEHPQASTSDAIVMNEGVQPFFSFHFYKFNLLLLVCAVNKGSWSAGLGLLVGHCRSLVALIQTTMK